MEYHLTGNEAAQLLTRLADHKHVSMRAPAGAPWVDLRLLIEAHYTEAELERYLDILRQRKATGIGFVRPRRPKHA